MALPGTDARHHTLVVLVENKAGVLARVSGLFARRGFNIFSLAVAPTEDERFSRITIVVDVASSPLEQITKQLYKLINVVKISELDPRDSVSLDGEPGRLDDFEGLLRPFGIVELQRTGRVALPKLERTTPSLRSVRRTA